MLTLFKREYQELFTWLLMSIELLINVNDTNLFVCDKSLISKIMMKINFQNYSDFQRRYFWKSVNVSILRMGFRFNRLKNYFSFIYFFTWCIYLLNLFSWVFLIIDLFPLPKHSIYSLVSTKIHLLLSLISLFNGISTFAGYLMSKPFS